MAMNLGDIVAHLKLEIGDFTNKLNEAKSSIDDTSKQFDGLTQAGQSLSTVGTALTAGVTAPVVALGAAAIKTGADFSTAMSKVQALSGASGEELQKLEAKAREMGATTKYSATEAADALGYMALAGWDADQSMTALPDVLNLAAASGMELAAASDLVTDYITAFGLEAGDAAMMADTLAYAQANSNTTTEQLGEAFKNCAVNAHGFGLDVQQTTALLGKLADSGLKGSEAGTALNAVFRDMTAKMKDGQIAIGNTNVAVMDANGNYRNMVDILRDVEAATAGMGDAEKQAALQSTFTADSIKAMGILLGATSGEIDAFTQELYGAEGAAKEMADTMNDNLEGDIATLKSAFEEFCLTIFDKVEPALRKLTQAATKIIQVLGKIPGPVMQVIVVIAAIAATIGPLLLIIGKTIMAVQKMYKTFMMLKALLSIGSIVAKLASMWETLQIIMLYISGFITSTLIPALGALWAFMLANPITFVIAAIAALIAIFVLLWNKCEGFRNFWINLWESCKSAITNFYNHNKATFDALKNFFTTAWEAIKTVFGGFITFLKGIFTGDMSMVVEGLKQMWEGYKMWWSNIWNAMKTIVVNIWDGIKSAISNFGEWLSNFFSNTLPNALNTFFTWLAELPMKIAYWLGYALGKVFEWKQNMVHAAVECAVNFVTTIAQWLAQLPGRVWNWLVNTYNKVVSWASKMIAKAKSTGTQFVNNVISFIKNLPSRIASLLSQALQKVISWGRQMISRGKSAASQTVSGIVNGFTSLPSKLYSAGVNAIQGLWNGIKSMAGSVISYVSNLAGQIAGGFKSALKIGSPSRLLRDEVGKWIPEGIRVGIEGNTKPLFQSLATLSDSIGSSIQPDLTSSLNLNTASTATAGINPNNPVTQQIAELKQALSDKLEAIDYEKMEKAFTKGASRVNNTILMDKKIVGKQVSGTVNEVNSTTKKRRNRLEGVSE